MQIWLLIGLAILSTGVGFFIPWRFPRWVKFALLVPLVGLYVVHAYEDVATLPLWAAIAGCIGGVLLAVRLTPYAFCCGSLHNHAADSRGVGLSVLAVIPLLAHAAFDAELFRTAGSYWVFIILVAHKLTDGAAIRFATGSLRGSRSRVLLVTVAIIATPLGLLLPEWATENIVHASAVAVVLGFYLYLAYALARQPSEVEIR